METFDIAIIIIIIIVVSLLIGLNINNSIDNKLSNVSVNIPPIKIPEPNIVVKIQKKCDSQDYDVYVEKEHSNTPMNKELFNPNIVQNNKHKIEKFSESNGETQLVKTLGDYSMEHTQQGITLPTTQGLNLPNNLGYNVVIQEEKPKIIGSICEQPVEKINIKSNNVTSENIKITERNLPVYPNTSENVQNPNMDDIVSYGDYVHWPQPKQEELPKVEYPKLVGNESLLLDKYETYKYLIRNDTDRLYIPNEEYKTINNQVTDLDQFDPSDYYRKNQQYVKSYLEDPKMRGANVTQIADNYAGPMDIGKINLTVSTKYPQPKNYIFPNSSVFNK